MVINLRKRVCLNEKEINCIFVGASDLEAILNSSERFLLNEKVLPKLDEHGRGGTFDLGSAERKILLRAVVHNVVCSRFMKINLMKKLR